MRYRPRPRQRSLSLSLQVAQTISLQPVSQGAKQQMTSKVTWRWPSEYDLPMAAKLSHAEITQARNLDVKRRAVRQCRTDLYARHDARAGRRWGWREVGLPPSPLAIW